jgi:hypothetical protein
LVVTLFVVAIFVVTRSVAVASVVTYFVVAAVFVIFSVVGASVVTVSMVAVPLVTGSVLGAPVENVTLSRIISALDWKGSHRYLNFGTLCALAQLQDSRFEP